MRKKNSWFDNFYWCIKRCTLPAKSADEIGMGKSLWADLENGIKDPQISTLWRIAEGLDIKPHVLVKLVEKELGENFSFLENTLGNKNL